MAHMEAHGPTLHPRSTPTRVDLDQRTGLKTVSFADGSRIEGVDCVLFATGRTPATDLLQLQNAGVETDARGFVKVDKKEESTVKGIFAVGDATTTGYELTPVAIAAGRRLADRLFGGEPETGIVYGPLHCRMAARTLFLRPCLAHFCSFFPPCFRGSLRLDARVPESGTERPGAG